MMDWMHLIEIAVGLISGFGAGLLTKSGRIKSKADAYSAMSEAYESRLTALHNNIALLNKMEEDQSNRIKDLNDALHDKTQRIRELTDKLYSSELEINRVQDMLNVANNKVTRLTEERDHERLIKEYFKGWQCHHSDCDQRRPPNPSIRGQKFKEPK